MTNVEQTTFRFAGFTLDLVRGRLLDGSKDIALRPKSFGLLSYLVREGGRVITKDELMSAIWPDVTVTEDSLTQCVHDVRQALGHAAALIRTIPKRGYVFEEVAHATSCAPITESRINRNGLPSDPLTPTPRRDGIAVMPLVLTKANPAHMLLLDGMTHDIISRLARLRSFHVIARGSTFALRHMADDPQAAGRALGVAYAVGGKVEVKGDRFHLCIDLVAVETGTIVWTDTLSFDRQQILNLLPELTERIVNSVEMQVTTAEARRAQAIPVERLDAWEHFHAGLHDAFRFDTSRIDHALVRLRTATELAPGFARAHAAQSFCHYFRVFSGTATDRDAEIAAARRTAEEALHADDTNPSAHWSFGRALWLEGDAAGCLHHCERSVALSPGFSLGHYMVGFVETHGGDARRALEQIDHVLSLTPFDPFLASMQITRAIALVRLGRVDEAAIWARDAARQPNAYSTLLAPAALILATAGLTAEAGRVVAKLRAVAPHFRTAHLNRSLHGMSDDVAVLFRKAAPQIGI